MAWTIMLDGSEHAEEWYGFVCYPVRARQAFQDNGTRFPVTPGPAEIPLFHVRPFRRLGVRIQLFAAVGLDDGVPEVSGRPIVFRSAMGGIRSISRAVPGRSVLQRAAQYACDELHGAGRGLYDSDRFRRSPERSEALFLKRFVQTVSYLPHFVSWVVVAGIVTKMLSTDNGIVNQMLVGLHIIHEPDPVHGEGESVLVVVTGADMWKETGWNAIIYLAAIAGIGPELYEAARVDGASRLRQIWHITLPGIRSTISFC